MSLYWIVIQVYSLFLLVSFEDTLARFFWGMENQKRLAWLFNTKKTDLEWPSLCHSFQFLFYKYTTVAQIFLVFKQWWWSTPMGLADKAPSLQPNFQDNYRALPKTATLLWSGWYHWWTIKYRATRVLFKLIHLFYFFNIKGNKIY